MMMTKDNEFLSNKKPRLNSRGFLKLSENQY